MTSDLKSERSRVRRVPERGRYDHRTLYQIVDAALICHVGFVVNGQPFVIPTLHARDGDRLLLHGATTSRLIVHASQGHELSVAITLVDGIVLARSIFHHSMNYRSAVLFGRGALIAESEKMAALERFSEKLLPGRWHDARLPNAKELKATSVVAIPIDTASSKIREGPPGDDEEDYALPVWAGLLPLKIQAGDLEPDPRLAAGIDMPQYLLDYRNSINGS